MNLSYTLGKQPNGLFTMKAILKAERPTEMSSETIIAMDLPPRVDFSETLHTFAMLCKGHRSLQAEDIYHA